MKTTIFMSIMGVVGGYYVGTTWITSNEGIGFGDSEGTGQERTAPVKPVKAEVDEKAKEEQEYRIRQRLILKEIHRPENEEIKKMISSLEAPNPSNEIKGLALEIAYKGIASSDDLVDYDDQINIHGYLWLVCTKYSYAENELIQYKLDEMIQDERTPRQIRKAIVYLKQDLKDK